MAAIISARKLVSADLALHGATFVIVEFLAGMLFPIGLWWLGYKRGARHSLLLWYLLVVGFNYLPLLLLAIWKSRYPDPIESLPSRSEMARTTAQQFWILIPFAIPAVTIWELRRAKR